VVDAEQRPDSPRRARTRERLLDAAYEVFAETGLAAASVEQIAERAGFTRGAFYSNFDTKEQLFLALMARGRDRWLADLAERVTHQLPEPGAPLSEDQIGEAIAQLLAGPFDHRTWTMVQREFRMLALRDPSLARASTEDRTLFEDSLVPIIREAARRAGRTFTVDVRTVLRLSMATYQDLVEIAALAGRDSEAAMADVRAVLTEVVSALTRPV